MSVKASVQHATQRTHPLSQLRLLQLRYYKVWAQPGLSRRVIMFIYSLPAVSRDQRNALSRQRVPNAFVQRRSTEQLQAGQFREV